MTATRPVLIHCDRLDCTRSYTGSERIWAVRRQANSDGWAYAGKHHHYDLCPDHASPEDGFVPLGRHVITAVTTSPPAESRKEKREIKSPEVTP